MGDRSGARDHDFRATRGGDYLLDTAGIVVALVAIRISQAAASLGQRSSASHAAALVNAGWLLILELLVITAAADRLMHGSYSMREVTGVPRYTVRLTVHRL